MIGTEDFDTFKSCYELLNKNKLQKDLPSVAYLKLIFDGKPYEFQGYFGREAIKHEQILSALEKQKKGIKCNKTERYYLRKYKLKGV